MQPVAAGTSGGRLVLGVVLLVILVLVTGPGGVSCVQHKVQYGLSDCKSQIRHDTTEDVEVECNGGGDWLTIRSGDVWMSVVRLSIVNYHTVYVEAGALATMKSPGSVLFENIETLYMLGRLIPDPENHPLKQGPISVSLNNVSYVQLETGSLSHWEAISVSIADANTCTIHNNAIVSSSKTSSMRLNSIANGQFYPGAFGTTLGTLSLTNVTINLPCQQGTFNGSIGRLSLQRVKLGGLNERCFDASKMWNSLSVLSSNLGDIAERGIHGRIENVSFQETSFGRIKPTGIELNVTRLTMNASSVQRLSKDGLSVRASDTILIQNSNIAKVSKNAFRGLELTTQKRGIKFPGLSLGITSNGFLRVSDINAVSLKDISVNVPCQCEIRKQVFQNFYDRRCPEPLSLDEKAMLRLAFRNIRCVNGSTTPYLLDYHCLHCDNPFRGCTKKDSGAMESDDGHDNDRDSDAVEGDADTNNTSSDAGTSSLTWLVTIPVCLVIGAGVAVLTMRWRRRSLSPQRSPSDRRPPSHRLTLADLRHPLPDLTQDTTRRDGGENAGHLSGASAGPKLPPDAGDDSLYESLPEPRPDSCEYEDLTNFRGSLQQGLYEEPPSSERKQSGTEASLTPKPPTCEPLYAEVHKDGMSTVKSSGTVDELNSPNSGQSVPLYAQVHKARNRTGDPASEWTSDSASAPKSPRAFDSGASATMTGQPDDGSTAIPVYAQVVKGRGRKDRNDHRAIGEPNVETETANDGSAVYASVIKHKLGRSHSQAKGHSVLDIPPEETAMPAAGHKAPEGRDRRTSSESLYEDGRSFAVGERPMQEGHSSTPGERGQQNLGASSRRDGLPRGRAVELPGAARLAAAGQENPLYAGTQTPVPSPDDAGASGDPGEDLQYNNLYESHQW